MDDLEKADNIKFIANPDGFDMTKLFTFNNNEQNKNDTKFVIIGNLIDSTSENGCDFLEYKIYNIRNIIKCVTDPNYYLIFGPRDLNKLKIYNLFFLVGKNNMNNMNDTKIYSAVYNFIDNIEYNEIIYPRDNVEIINQAGQTETINMYNYIDFAISSNDMLKFYYPFWTFGTNYGINKGVQFITTNGASDYKFFSRFIEIFYDIDALNLIFTIPIELDTMGNKNILNDINKIKGSVEYKDFIIGFEKCDTLKCYSKQIYEKFNLIFKENNDRLKFNEFEKKMLDILAYYTMKTFHLMLQQPLPNSSYNPSSANINNLRGLLYNLYKSNKNKFIHTYIDKNNDYIRCILSYGGLNKKLAKNGEYAFKKIFDKIDKLSELYLVLSSNEYNDNKITEVESIRNGVLNYLNKIIKSQHSENKNVRENKKKKTSERSPLFNPDFLWGGYNFFKSRGIIGDKIEYINVDLQNCCNFINSFLTDIIDQILNNYAIGYEQKPSTYNIFLSLMIENFLCTKTLFKNTDEFNNSAVCVNPFENTMFNKVFSSRNVSPIVSDIFNIRYNDDITDNFINIKDQVIIQITGHANNYSKINPHKSTYSDALIYGALIDLYGKYNGDYKSFLICLDNSVFFNSVLERNYESRAIFSYNTDEKKINKIDDQEITSYGGLHRYKVKNKICLYDMYRKHMVNNLDIKDTILIDTNLFDTLIDFKKMQDGRQQLNYYGTSNNNIILSTIGIEQNNVNNDAAVKNADTDANSDTDTNTDTDTDTDIEEVEEDEENDDLNNYPNIAFTKLNEKKLDDAVNKILNLRGDYGKNVFLNLADDLKLHNFARDYIQLNIDKISVDNTLDDTLKASLLAELKYYFNKDGEGNIYTFNHYTEKLNENNDYKYGKKYSVKDYIKQVKEILKKHKEIKSSEKLLKFKKKVKKVNKGK